MKVVVGLGNPGSRYAGTRHNVGFAVVDLLAESSRAGRWQRRFEAQVAELQEDAGKILLVKPETFMNLSGRSVRQVFDFYQVPIDVDSPGEGDATDHVLGRFRPSERAVIDEAVQRGAQAVLTWAEQGIEVCMNQYNSSQ